MLQHPHVPARCQTSPSGAPYISPSPHRMLFPGLHPAQRCVVDVSWTLAVFIGSTGCALAHVSPAHSAWCEQSRNVCLSETEKRHITQALNSNGYPTEVVKRNWQTHWQTALHSIQWHPEPLWLSRMSDMYLSLSGWSLLRWRSGPVFAHIAPRQTLVNLKDRIPLQQWVGVVYRNPCGTGPKVYVGQICRMLDHQLKEHKRAITSGNLVQLQSMRLMSRISSIVKRPRWRTPIHNNTEDVHLSCGTSVQRQRPKQRLETCPEESFTKTKSFCQHPPS